MNPNDVIPGYRSDEIITSESTRASRLKWVIVVDSDLPPGRLANAVACVAASTGDAIAGMLGPQCPDASGYLHPGLPWAGCTVLGASAERLANTRARAVAAEGVWVGDMPLHAQVTRVHDDYEAELARTAPGDLQSLALSIVGPRDTVDRIVKKLRLL
ncbi:MAG: DUF2000 domain-containing protein [Herbiconiux sp.]|uniref:DUF2000 domain-containing protein n=1 Tax=Herbiconiux sp. TaxID=1871186 RepID=UPI0012042043|nr:DUF2000 domain-containing protein [Herbiconiux sp.]TAJ49431.1 MAG: DUF2000 domain-containing protein [Herbiconiux sp.]